MPAPLPPILPAGTHVVTVGATGPADAPRPAGAVASVVAEPQTPDGSYRVRFPDGTEESLPRERLTVRRLTQEGDLESAAPVWDPRDHVAFRCVVGSRAYGLEGPGSDTDRRGFFLPPSDRLFSLFGVPEQVETHETQETYWEARKFVVLALKAKPNVLECLYSPMVEFASPAAEELLAMRGRFLSRLLFQTYNGYVLSQFKKLQHDIAVTGAVKWKHAMHLVRLLLSGAEALRTGEVPVRVGAHRDRLLAIKRGEVPWPEVDAWRLELHRDFDAAYEATRLPERPDFAAADDWLIRARRSVL
jgi:hypothetical protein